MSQQRAGGSGDRGGPSALPLAPWSEFLRLLELSWIGLLAAPGLARRFSGDGKHRPLNHTVVDLEQCSKPLRVATTNEGRVLVSAGDVCLQRAAPGDTVPSDLAVARTQFWCSQKVYGLKKIPWLCWMESALGNGVGKKSGISLNSVIEYFTKSVHYYYYYFTF